MKYKTAFRLAVRAIGILVIAQSLPWCATAALSFTLSTVLGGLWSLSGPGALWTFELRYGLIHGMGLIIGLYLLFGGNWIVNRVIPSNRPYCHECAYELTGLPAEGNCPECGTPYRRNG